MFELKPISKHGIPGALEKVQRYRLLNEPIEAESICRDILLIDSENQDALVLLILTLTDQFNKGITNQEADTLIPRLQNEFNRMYYKGIILERKAKAYLARGVMVNHSDAYEWLQEAMVYYEKAEKKSPENNEDAVLRWNACVRTIQRYKLTPRPPESRHMEWALE
ncbi:hypothetical protein AAG747_04140 [Rapidithrix thailandica]|uniref:Uncharacterized protein n=1 Tax=Rapidithrix thailandica TaxID=413964 RepID=A0AAW9RTX7_9BACT